MSREKSAATGEKGEERAAKYLIRQGCTILARNWQAHPGEIDIVAECPNDEGTQEL
ncbi:MAG: YraN family protein, partial [Chloroflexia bacterium]